MKIIKIQSSNLNNSLVFYRALLNRMPLEITPSCIQFETEHFILEVAESIGAHKIQTNVFEIQDAHELAKINQRMSRFNAIEKMIKNCEVVDRAIGLTDPNGNRWVIGDPEVKVDFKKCYIELITI
ncbi:hypothetical protein [Ekhidna sp.]|uniref:hypothetical protein n=1 Tax=Ekhidna sp. TaxID=2608089 RepID=UPI00329A6EEB